LDINKFADLKSDEFIKFYTGIRRKGRSAVQTPTRFYGAPYSSEARNGFNVELGFDQVNFSGSGGAASSDTSGFGASGSARFGGSSGSGQSGSSAAAQQGQNMTNVFMPSALLASDIKDEVDWRKEGAITPVKNQGNHSVLYHIAPLFV
jgi:hypothetical protein